MNKIAIIIKREFLTRVRKKSFIVMTILGPFLFAAMIILPMVFATMEDSDVKNIAVIDSSKIFINKIPDGENLKFKYIEGGNINRLSKSFREEGYWGVLYISHVVTYSPNGVLLYSYSQPSFGNRMYIESALKKEMEKQILYANNQPGLQDKLESLKSNLNIKTIKIDEDGKQKESSSEIAMIIGYASGILIYFFIFLFGTQVMRGVIEEKTNRIIEVIISSVRPFELMIGKITGIAGVALLQFLLWVILTLAFINVGQAAMFPDLKKNVMEQRIGQDILKSAGQDQAKVTPMVTTSSNDNTNKAQKIMEEIGRINLWFILLSFIFYFIFGYLLYAGLFAAVGSAVDNEADTQQFVLPVTLPLILSIYVMINTINNPEGALSFWFSMIPLTSPIVMMVRIPFGVQWWELALSMSFLVIGFLATTWLAGKIYRTGILMYGKKINYRELLKWIKYK